MSVDISTDSRPIYWPAYRPILNRYGGQYIGRESVDVPTNISVEGAQNTHDPSGVKIGRFCYVV